MCWQEDDAEDNNAEENTELTGQLTSTASPLQTFKFTSCNKTQDKR